MKNPIARRVLSAALVVMGAAGAGGYSARADNAGLCGNNVTIEVCRTTAGVPVEAASAAVFADNTVSASTSAGACNPATLGWRVASGGKWFECRIVDNKFTWVEIGPA